MKDKKKDIISEILDNVNKDREKADEYLDSISSYIETNSGGMSGEDFSKIMMSAAKLLETSQKSNEQIVKLLEIRKKFKPKKVKQDDNLSESDIDKIYKGETVEI